MSVSRAAIAVMEAFPGSAPDQDPAMWAGVADELPEAYASTLPVGLLRSIEMAAASGWVWGPCTSCGRGKLMAKPPTPQKSRAIGEDDGPVCNEWVRGPYAERVKCKGRNYPLAGPIRHPLAAERPMRPW